MNHALHGTTHLHRQGARFVMLRAVVALIVLLALTGAARAAGDVDTCRNAQAEAAARLAACDSVIADEAISAKSRAFAYWYRGDTLAKKRDYDNAIAAFSAALAIDPDNASTLNSRGIAYLNKGDNEHGIFQLTTNHPARVAERVAVLDLLSNGRCEFGMMSATR